MRVVVLLLIATAFAGCAAEVAPEEPQACVEDECQVQVKEDVPVPLDIRGVIVDETITPVKGVNVALYQGGDKLATVATGGNGAFKFLGLDEGFYRVVAAGNGFSGAETQVDLQEGSPASIRIQITSIPPIVPIHTLIEWDGFVSCSTYTIFVFVSAGCGALGIVTGNTQATEPARIFWDEIMEPGMPPSWLQAELMWQPNQLLADSLWMQSRLYHPDNGYGSGLASPSGKSPLVMHLDAEAIHDKGIGQATNVSMPHGVRYMVWAAGENIATPGFAFEQPFTMYFSLLYHQTPDEGWMFVRDGMLE